MPGRAAGWIDTNKPAAKAKPRPVEPPKAPRPGMGALRTVPADDPLTIAGQAVAGYLAVPAYTREGTIQSIQFMPPAGGKKLNLPGASMGGASFTVGELAPGGPVYLAEGIGQAWACWQATGHRAVCCFGWGNVGRVARDLRQRDEAARLVLVPD